MGRPYTLEKLRLSQKPWLQLPAVSHEPMLLKTTLAPSGRAAGGEVSLQLGSDGRLAFPEVSSVRTDSAPSLPHALTSYSALSLASYFRFPSISALSRKGSETLAPRRHIPTCPERPI